MFCIIHDFFSVESATRLLRDDRTWGKRKYRARSISFMKMFSRLCKTIRERRCFASGYFGLARPDWRLVFIVWPNLPKSRKWRDARRAGEGCYHGISILRFPWTSSCLWHSFSLIRIGGAATKLTPKRWVTRSLGSATTVFSCTTCLPYVTLRDLDFKAVVLLDFICKCPFFHKFFY